MADTEDKRGFSIWCILRWWPILLGPLAVVGLAIWYCAVKGDGEEPEKIRFARETLTDFLENSSVYLILAATVLYWLKAVYTRNMTFVLLTAFCASLMLRELHWVDAAGNDPIKAAIYVLLVMIGVWAICWRDLLDPPNVNWKHTVLLTAAVLTFAFSQAVEKRIFERHLHILPYSNIHSQYEEIAEFTGHALLFLAAVFASCRKKKIETDFITRAS